MPAQSCGSCGDPTCWSAEYEPFIPPNLERQSRSSSSSDSDSSDSSSTRESRRKCETNLRGRARRKIEKAKREHRSGLKLHKWARYNHAERIPQAELEGRYTTCPFIDRVHASHLSVEQFVELYEKPYESPCASVKYVRFFPRYRPMIITGAADQWPARKKWSFENLERDYGDRRFKCGEDDDGYAIKVRCPE